ncbi:MAG: CusA/CzcA family heavy metal efflux RND transporter, partial [Bacteroidota bacterium]
MVNAIIAFSLRHRAAVFLGTFALVVGGIIAFLHLPIDAVPDITNNQVQILTSAPALSPLEIEQLVTLPIELALKSLPDQLELRSISKAGISVVTVVFSDHVDTYFARGQVLEKLREAEEHLPPTVGRPELAPVSTGLGEIFRYVVRDTTGKLSPMDLRTVQDWIVRRQLLGTPGLAEVNSLGGYLKQFHVVVDPDALVSFGLTLRDVFDAVARSGGTAGGAYIESGPEQYSVRSVGLMTKIEDIENTVIRTGIAGTPILVKHVAAIEIGPALRFGSASRDGEGEVVTGITMQLKGANARVVVNAVKDRIEQIKSSLPPGVVVEPYYDRESLVDRTIATVTGNLAEGALLVIAVLLLFLANLRAGFILASVIPLSMMFAAIMMVVTGQSGNLMSLGAIDFGLLVDGSLIIVESCLRLVARRLNASDAATMSRAEMRNVVYSGAVEVIQSAKFGVFIIIIVYLPILTLQGIEGKFFRPMALTVSFALVGALLLSITYVPAICSVVLKRNGHIRESPIILFLHRYYRPFLTRVLGFRFLVLAVPIALFAAAIFGFTQLGGEFIPRLDEGDISISLVRLPSVSLAESQKITTRVERLLMKFPEVKTIVSHTGRAEISTDPMGVELADVFVMLKPRDQWNSGQTKEKLVEAMAKSIDSVPGVGAQFLQPIEMRMNELIAGVKGDVAVKVFGEDFAVLDPAAEKIMTIMRHTAGSADVTADQTTGLPQLIVRPDRAAIARYGLAVEDINEVITTAIGGKEAGEVFEGEKRFDIVVRYRPESRGTVEAIGNILISTPTGQRIPLSTIADVRLEDGPAQVSREEGSRFMTVQSNVRERDVESFVEEIQKKIAAGVKLPPGYSIAYGGQFENLQAASRRLMIVVPVSLLLIFLLLFQTFRSVRVAGIIFLCVPMAAIGGVGGLMIAGLPFSISAGVGFIALFGIAVLNGIVMVAAIRKFQSDGSPMRDAVLAGADERLRPVVTTAALAGLGFLPMMLAHGAGAEVQRPLATVVIGGLITSTLLTLIVLPVIFDWLGGTVSSSDTMEGFTVANPETETVNTGNINIETANAETVTTNVATTNAQIANAENKHQSPDSADRKNLGASASLLILLAMLFSVSISVSAQESLTLENVRERAIMASPELRRGEATTARERALRNAESLFPNPEIFYSVDESPSAALTGAPTTSFGISQTVEFPTIHAARNRVADHRIAGTKAETDALRRDLERRAALAFLDVTAARDLLDLTDSAVAIAGRFSAASSRRKELG